MAITYRKSYNLFASNGILFNHESPRRGETFVTRKITQAIARIIAGQQKKLYLGNLDARRDWGYAPEYVELMWLILQQNEPNDYVVGTGESHSVREFVEEAFSYVGLDWRDNVAIDPKYFRPLDVDSLIADSTKASDSMGWRATISFKQLVRIMVDADMQMLGLEPIGEGATILERWCPHWHRWGSSVTALLANNVHQVD
jgi:GDPmannose 4,6-dehydratase